MTRTTTVLCCTLAFALTLAIGCGKSGEEDAGAATPENTGELSRSAALGMLRTVNGLLAARDYSRMDEFFGVPAGMPKERLAEQVATLPDKGEISAAGIEILAREATWGPLTALEDNERLKARAERFGFDPTHCFGFQKSPAEVVFCRGDDDRYRIVRLDDVGKLAK